MTHSEKLQSKFARWQFARRLTLGTILLTGTLFVAQDSAQRWAQHQRASFHQTRDRVQTYSGIGVEIERRDGEHFVRRVFPNSPAEGKLFPGAKLVSVDGMTPGCTRGWSAMIRGPVGTHVELTVEYPGTAAYELDLERDIIRVHY